jgi:hypothetical protein
MEVNGAKYTIYSFPDVPRYVLWWRFQPKVKLHGIASTWDGVMKHEG